MAVIPFETALNLFPTVPFFPKRWDELSSELGKLSSEFELQATIPGVPDDAPLDIPRLVMDAGEKGVKLTFMPSKIIFAIDLYYDEKNRRHIAKEYFSKLLTFLETKGVIFKRIGLVTQYYVETDDALNLIRQRFLNTKDLPKTTNILLSMTVPDKWEDIDVNMLYKIGTGTWQHVSQPEEREGLLVDVDVNNNQNTLDAFSKRNDALGFFQWSLDKNTPAQVEAMLGITPNAKAIKKRK